MDAKFDEYKKQAIATQGDVVPRAVLELVFEIIEKDPLVTAPINADGAFAGFGKQNFHISPFKLASGLAGLTKALLDPSTLLFEGLGIVAAVATLSESVRKVTVDEAAICQALYEARKLDGQPTVSQPALVEKLAELTGEKNELQARYDAAIASLQRLRIVELELARDSVRMTDWVLIGRRRT